MDGAVLHRPNVAVLLNDELHSWVGRILNESQGIPEPRRVYRRPQLAVRLRGEYADESHGDGCAIK